MLRNWLLIIKTVSSANNSLFSGLYKLWTFGGFLKFSGLIYYMGAMFDECFQYELMMACLPRDDGFFMVWLIIKHHSIKCQCQFEPIIHAIGWSKFLEDFLDAPVVLLRGEEAKTRPPETLTNTDLKVLYRINVLFLGNISDFQSIGPLGRCFL